MPKSSELSEYIDILLRSQFAQFRLLSPPKFSRFLADCGIRLTVQELEYYDKKEVIRPVVRLHRQKISEQWPKYPPIETSSFALKYYYEHGLIELPREGDFKPWKDYDDGRETAIEQFYHHVQFVPIKHLILLNNISLGPKYFEDVTDVNKAFDNMFSSRLDI